MFHYFKYYKWRMIFLTMLIILRQFFLVLAQKLNSDMFDQLAENQFREFIYVIILILVTWTVMIGLDSFLKIRQESFSQDIQQKIREDIAKKIVDSDFGHHHKQAQYLSWLNNDILMIAQKGIYPSLNFVRGLSGVIFAALTLIHYHWSLLVATLVGFMCMFYVPKVFNHKIQSVSQVVTQGNEQFVTSIEDGLKGYPTYFALNLLPQFVTKINMASKAIKLVMMKQIRLDAVVIAVNFSVNVLFQIILTVVAAYCYFNGWVQIGIVAMVGSLADIIFSELGNMSYQMTSIKGIKPIFDKYHTLEPEIIDVPNFHKGPLFEAHNVNLSYGDGVIFDNISFIIHQGTKHLISGISGSGKSSLLKMMLGYHKGYSGVLKYKGQPIKEISSKVLAQELMYLSQEPHIFKGTVRENIELGITYDESQLVTVLERVGFENPVNILYQYAPNLSGGQKQRLALARVLIRHPKIVICDEITSALDKESSKMIEELLLNDSNLTVIMITHALQSDRTMFDSLIEM